LHEIDPRVLESLTRGFAAYDRAMELGALPHPHAAQSVPGYTMVSRQGGEAFSFYRDWLLALVAELRGSGKLLQDLSNVAQDAKATNPSRYAELLAGYESQRDRYRLQWRNLFLHGEVKELDHAAVHVYGQKYEVEWPLIFLADLRHMVQPGGGDGDIDRFRDARGKLRKGVMVDYIVAGLGSYPTLKAAIENGYRPQLRNAIAHNEFVLDADGLSPLDRGWRVGRDEFVSVLLDLQEVQNAALWTINHFTRTPEELIGGGVISLGWVPLDEMETPTVYAFQLLPFFELDPDAKWLSPIRVERKDRVIETHYGGMQPTRGGMVADLMPLFELVREQGTIRCAVQPIMPCIHDCKERYEWFDGDFCMPTAPVVKDVPITVDL